MKLWATFAAAILAVSAFATESKPVQDNESKWAINVGFAIPEGDLKDLGVDNMFVVGADFQMNWGGTEGSNSSTYAGLLAMFGDGDADLETFTWGFHVGLNFPFGGDGMTPSEWNARIQGGFYNHKLDVGGSEEDDWGFGGAAMVSFTPAGGTGFSINGGYYFMPEVSGVDNRGWVISVSIPVK